jgi:hypothetical protein
MLVFVLSMIALLSSSQVWACGGLFCQTSPVLQEEERIIFTINGDDTVTAYVQINYTGSAPNFSWVVPVPTVPEIDVAEIESFDELEMLTDPIIVAPPRVICAESTAGMDMAQAEATFLPTPTVFATVEVLSSGTAGPYVFDVIQSPDPNALIYWLRENSYQITPMMNPLIHEYNVEGMLFLAMKLQPDKDVQEIQPVVMTYESSNPMIPIRLTAIAAVEDMRVLTWVFADEQAVPMNYANPVILDESLRGNYNMDGGTNYHDLVNQTVDFYGGQAFITEYAQPTIDLMALHPDDRLILELAQQYDYVTRLFGRMSPAEMTLDPSFVLDDSREDISNVRNLSNVNPHIFWGCQQAPIEIDENAAVSDTESLDAGRTTVVYQAPMSDTEHVGDSAAPSKRALPVGMGIIFIGMIVFGFYRRRQ